MFTLNGLSLGTTYEFIIEAQNSIGYSDASDSLTILHALPPAKPDAPTTATLGQDIIVSYTMPVDNGAEVLSYNVLIRQGDGFTFTQLADYCINDPAL